MPNTELHDLVASLGAVYWQDPQVPEGYVLSGPTVTHAVNLIDGQQIPETGTNSVQIGKICTQDAFLFNPEGTNSTTRFNLDGYGAVASVLQGDFTLFAVSDGSLNTFIFGRSTAAVNAGNVGVRLTTGAPDRALQVTKRKQTGGNSESHTVSSTLLTLTHHVHELLCTDTTWEFFVDGVSIGSGAWANAGVAYSLSMTRFFVGTDGVTSTGITRQSGQMVLFPSILSSSDRTRVRDMMSLVMCSGHQTGDNPIWASTDF